MKLVQQMTFPDLVTILAGDIRTIQNIVNIRINVATDSQSKVAT
ncbi:hypothetical protein ACIQW9_00750 [Herminiimonas sp. NPDC097707]